MKTVGIIGGIGPESTVEYYRRIIVGYRRCKQDGNYPVILINSINMTKMLNLIGANQLEEVTVFLAGEMKRLADAGADFAVMASNTPHLIFNEVQTASSIPMISIVEATCQKAKTLGLDKVGLFGTKFTMQGSFYPDEFSKEGIAVITPDEADQNFIHQKYMDELVNGVILDETRQQLLKIAGKLREEKGINGLILGGTELPLILKAEHAPKFTLLDTTMIHVERIVDVLISGKI